MQFKCAISFEGSVERQFSTFQISFSFEESPLSFEYRKVNKSKQKKTKYDDLASADAKVGFAGEEPRSPQSTAKGGSRKTVLLYHWFRDYRESFFPGSKSKWALGVSQRTTALSSEEEAAKLAKLEISA